MPTGIYKRTEWHKKRQKDSVLKGKNHPMYGTHPSQATLKKLSESHKGMHCSSKTEFTSEKMRKLWKDPIFRAKQFLASYGKKCPKRSMLGKKHPNWQGGISRFNDIIRNMNQNKDWIKAIFRKNNYTCQVCNIRGGNLEAHHIISFSKILNDFLNKYNSLSITKNRYQLRKLAITFNMFWDINNGITLCKKCHKEVV